MIVGFVDGNTHLRKKNVQPGAKRAQTAEAETTSASNAKKVNAVAEENYSDHDDEPDSWLNAVIIGRPHATATLRINDRDVRFQLDTAADVNTICQKHVKKE